MSGCLVRIFRLLKAHYSSDVPCASFENPICHQAKFAAIGHWSRGRRISKRPPDGIDDQ